MRAGCPDAILTLGLLLFPLAGPIRAEGETKDISVTGLYRNLSFNVDGAGGAQRNMSPLILYPDSQYTWGKEKGRWSLREGRLVLSGRPGWGEGRVNKDRQILFEFVRDEKQFTVTMYRAGDAPEPPPAPETPSATPPRP
ncbi:MAG: hypothetical protein HYU36_13340 [Planctomycetes bacterium]|nr:hypothetical protein [Planctomycetota bacterium]